MKTKNQTFFIHITFYIFAIVVGIQVVLLVIMKLSNKKMQRRNEKRKTEPER